ncbi:MAG: hypothetical protein H6772_03895 [Pseudomonadales bacterium]|nr:hypothetical protein [Pseudomonadales bacterium]
MPENQSQVESLEELRRIDPQNETDPIKLKLAEIFSLSELDLYNDLISDQQRLQQIKLIEEVDRIRDWILQKLRERNEEAKKIEQLIESVDYLSRADKHASDLKYFPEVKDIVNNLSSFADALKFIDDFKSSSEITEDQMLKLIDLLQSFFIEFDQKMIDDYQSLFTDSKSVSNKVRKILFKIRAKKSRAIYEGTNASIMDLQNEVTKKLHESISSIIEQIKSQIERIDIDAVDDGDGYLEIFSEFNKLEMLVIQNAHNSLSVIIPEELASLPRIVEKLLDEFRHKLRLSKEEKIAQLNDPSSVIIGAQTKLEDCLNETDIVLPQAREQVTSLVTLISGHSTNGGSKFNQEISELLEGKRFAHFLISRPHELRRQLYNMYLNSELPREKRKEFFKQAMNLMKELVQTQTEAFFVAYDKVWTSFQLANLDEIQITRRDIRQEFFRCGYEIASDGEIDFVDALIRARDNHNELINVLKEQLDIENSSEIQLGSLLFKAYARAKSLDPSNFPYGEVRLDTTPPVTSIRLICADERDYGFAADELSTKDYQNSMVNKIISGGFTYSQKQKFSFEDGKSKNFPFTVIRGSNDEKYQKTTIWHEDAHQAIRLNTNEEESRISAEKRNTVSLSKEFIFDQLKLTSYNHSEAVSKWRDIIIPQLDKAVTMMRDEVQAYLTEGTDVSRIREYLSDSSEDASYDYVCDFNFRSSQIDQISKKYEDPEERDALIKLFKKDVLKARAAYDEKKATYLNRVESVLSRFLQDDNEDVAKRKLALLVRHTTPEEFMVITRYLRTNGKKNVETENGDGETIDDFDKKKFTEKLNLFNDEQMDKLLVAVPNELKTVLSFMQKISAKAPGYIRETLGSIEIMDEIVLSRNVVRKIINYQFDLTNAIKTSLVWTKKDAEEKKEYEKNKFYQVDKMVPATPSAADENNAYFLVNLAMKKIWRESTHQA